MESNLNQPLLFFETFIPNIKSFISKDIDEFVENSGFAINKVNKEKGEVDYIEFNHNNEPIIYTYTIKKNLISILKSEYQKSKDLINQLVASKVADGDNYVELLLVLEKSLNYTIKKSHGYFSLFPVLLTPLRLLTEYVNEKYLSDYERKLKLDISQIELFNDSDYDITVNNILGYFKGYNDKRVKILSDEDFDLMISYLDYYIKNDSIPIISKRIEEVNISKAQLRYSFWVLHKHLYTTRPIKDDFIKLIKEIFVCFDSWEFSTLKNKFGNKDKVVYMGKSYMPEIIKIELRDN